jgi:hypothetical protein
LLREAVLTHLAQAVGREKAASQDPRRTEDRQWEHEDNVRLLGILQTYYSDPRAELPDCEPHTAALLLGTIETSAPECRGRLREMADWIAGTIKRIVRGDVHKKIGDKQ